MGRFFDLIVIDSGTSFFTKYIMEYVRIADNENHRIL